MDECRPSSASDVRIAPPQYKAKRFKMTTSIALLPEVQSIFKYAVPPWIVPRPVDFEERQFDDLR